MSSNNYYELNTLLNSTEEIKVYKQRWIILLLYCMSCSCSILPWISYSVIANVISEYYNVSYQMVDWTSLIFFLVYFPVNFISNYILNRWSLRTAIIIGMSCTCVGSWMKIATVNPDRFWLVLFSQGVIALSYPFLLSTPSKVAATWFGINEISTACGIGCVFQQIGVSLGFLLPLILVDENKEVFQNNLYYLTLGLALTNTVLVLLLLKFFSEKPPTAPSLAQFKIKQNRHIPPDYIKSLKRVLRNRSFVLLLTSNGIDLGVYFAVSTLLNQIILQQYPNAETDVGTMGVVMNLTGLLGSFAGGFVLDKFHRPKLTILVAQTMTAIVMVAFTFVLGQSIQYVFLTTALLGFFVNSQLPLGLEIGVELTYPESEGTTGGLIISSSFIAGIGLEYLFTFFISTIGTFYANILISLLLFVGVIITASIRFDLKRSAAQIG